MYDTHSSTQLTSTHVWSFVASFLFSSSMALIRRFTCPIRVWSSRSSEYRSKSRLSTKSRRRHSSSSLAASSHASRSFSVWHHAGRARAPDSAVREPDSAEEEDIEVLPSLSSSSSVGTVSGVEGAFVLATSGSLFLLSSLFLASRSMKAFLRTS